MGVNSFSSTASDKSISRKLEGPANVKGAFGGKANALPASLLHGMQKAHRHMKQTLWPLQ
jgi:hypothetical protein